jgi:hypothetical protein
MRPPTHALVLPVLALALLGACDGTPTGPLPEQLVGAWYRAIAPDDAPEEVTEFLLEFDPDRRFRWTVTVSGPAGREADGLIERITLLGDWRLRGERLGLRIVVGLGWKEGSDYVADYVAEWRDGHTVRVEGDRLLLTFRAGSGAPEVPGTLEFHRRPR